MESDALNFQTLGLVTELCDPGPDFGTRSVEFFEHWSLVSSNSDRDVRLIRGKALAFRKL